MPALRFGMAPCTATPRRLSFVSFAPIMVLFP
jgi:hypothetical protein